MTDIIKHVPPEVWLNVFHQIGRAGKLCQSRLVCRQWSQLAEIAMFGEKLFVYGSRVAKLFAYLKEKPQKARLIKNLTMQAFPEKESAFIDLSRAAFTDNLEYLSTGSWSASESFYAALVEAAESLSTTEYKLKAMPNPAEENSKKFINALLTFRDTLQQLQISMECINENPVLNKLKVFKQLEDLSLNAEPLINVKGLDTVLRNCPFLSELKLAYPDSDENMTQSDPFTITWTVDSVEKVSSLQKVAIDMPHLDLVLYLIYKYPSIQRLICGSRVFYQEELSGRLLDAIKHIPQTFVGFNFATVQGVRPTIPAICGKSDTPVKMSVRICHFKGNIGFKAYMNVAEIEGQQELRIGVDGLAANNVQLGILDELCTMSDRCTIEHLCVDGLRSRWWDPDTGHQLISIYHVFETLPSLKTLSIFVERLEYKPIEADSRMKGKLEELDIENAAIDAGIFPQISQLYPKLYRLQLADCSIINADGQHQVDVFSITMPHTSLAFLSVDFTNVTYNGVDHAQVMRDKLISHHSCYLQVSLLSLEMTVYCKLEKGTAVFITYQDFELERKTNESVLFSVTCENVARIHVNAIADAQVDIATYVMQQLQASLDKLQLVSKLDTQNDSEREDLDMRLAVTEQKHDKYLATSASLNSKLEEVFGFQMKGNEIDNFLFAKRFFY
ncbi:Dimethyladenosine transferase [Mucor velutinosus]|uniref:Dimethyladenosine transferase n=1 Tax=Mucor velutinosus TaxID=708070 RepID=A0AAN7DG64_9FUNG|nr:Dimethyladenosine transferase [Mucor velutinosus]